MPDSVETDDVVEATLYLSHKYNLAGLSAICVRFLLNLVEARTAAKYFRLASVFNEEELKEKALWYIVR